MNNIISPRVNFETLTDFENQRSPYYSDSHKRYAKYIRNVHKTFLSKYWNGISKCDKLPRSFFKELATKYPGAYFFPFGYGEWIDPVLNKAVKWDPFYSIIFTYETCGVQGGLASHIHYIAIPPLLHFGNNNFHKSVIEEVRKGDKLISLAISEMTGGSDVARIKTTAKKTSDGKYYIINGSKYYITGGDRADYFTTLCKTGNSIREVSLILIPRQKGVYTSKINMQGAELNETSSVTFVNVKVPVRNLIGVENQGFKPLMYNFNYERFIVACDMVAGCRLCLEDAILWAKERKTFGKRLMDHQIIKHKIADMSRLVISCQLFLEKLGYDLKFDQYGRKDKSIPRNIALLKVHCSKSYQKICIECSQIFGGRSYVRGGRGGRVEEAYRGVRASAIAAGSEEIMYNLAAKQAKL